MMEAKVERVLSPMASRFSQSWPIATADSNVTLHGFQRFKTTHLINLRLLEQEIAEMDRKLYQAGLSLGHDISAADRLGLKTARRDSDATCANETITDEFVEKLRRLISQYGPYEESLVSLFLRFRVLSANLRFWQTNPSLRSTTSWPSRRFLYLTIQRSAPNGPT